MTTLSKVLIFAVGSAIVYTVVSKIADKIEYQSTQDDADEFTDEIMEELEDEFDDEVIENVFYRIRKGFREYMSAQANEIREKFNFCREVLNSAQTRLTLGIVTVAIGGGLIASAYIKLPE